MIILTFADCNGFIWHDGFRVYSICVMACLPCYSNKLYVYVWLVNYYHHTTQWRTLPTYKKTYLSRHVQCSHIMLHRSLQSSSSNILSIMQFYMAEFFQQNTRLQSNFDYMKKSVSWHISFSRSFGSVIKSILYCFFSFRRVVYKISFYPCQRVTPTPTSLII